MMNYINMNWQVFKAVYTDVEVFVEELDDQWIFYTPKPPVMVRSIVMKDEDPEKNKLFVSNLSMSKNFRKIESITEDSDEITSTEKSDIIEEPITQEAPTE